MIPAQPRPRPQSRLRLRLAIATTMRIPTASASPNGRVHRAVLGIICLVELSNLPSPKPRPSTRSSITSFYLPIEEDRQEEAGRDGNGRSVPW